MSHFSSIVSSFKDKDCLVNALVQTGIPREAIEVHETPQLLEDYRGQHTMYRFKDFRDARFKDGDCAQVIIRRKHLGSANNDAGFYIDVNGESVTLLCDFSRKATKFNDAWITKVRMEYDCEILAKKAKALGKPFQRIEKGGKVFACIGA